MKPTQRTLVFVIVAVVSTGLAVMANQFTKPRMIAGFGDFGQEFFREFTDASKAASIRVVSFDDATASSKVFSVENKDGWRIPSYHGYPADGKEQLAKAAASVMGLKRGALASRRKADHERFGVIDPLDEENTAIKGRGTRITLFEKGDTPLADFIVGKKVEGSEDKRYIRKADEANVYMVNAKFDVSTKFADWAETDLLKISGWDLVKLKATRPNYNDDGELEGVETVDLTREKSGDPWKMSPLDEATEELKTDDINTMVTTLDDLRLVGVRPKPVFDGKPLLTSDLKMAVPAELRSNPQVVGQLQNFLISSLKEKGFRLGKDEEGNRQVVSNEGELLAATKDGVVCRLTFGAVFSGTEEEVEIGSKETAKADDKSASKEGDAPKVSGEKKDDAQETEKKKNEELKKSRYLFVRAEFDESLLGPRPVEPVKPEPPPGVEAPADLKSDDAEKKPDTEKKTEADKKADLPEKKEASEKAQDAESKSDSTDDETDDEETDSKSDTKKDDATKSDKAEGNATEKKTETEKKAATTDANAVQEKADNKSQDAKADAPKKDLKAEYQEALKKYDIEKGRYATELKAHEAKVESGKQKVQELNDRFADWFYVISNESFDKLRLTRADLVKQKDKPAADATEKDATEKKDSESQPKDDEKKGDEKKESEKPSDEAKSEAAKDGKPEPKKSEDQSADDKKSGESPKEDKKPDTKDAEANKAEKKKPSP